MGLAGVGALDGPECTSPHHLHCGTSRGRPLQNGGRPLTKQNRALRHLVGNGLDRSVYTSCESFTAESSKCKYLQYSPGKMVGVHKTVSAPAEHTAGAVLMCSSSL